MASEKCVVVGAGGIAGAWLPALAIEKGKVVGIVDIDITRAKSRIDEYKLNCEASTDLKALLKRTRPDFVIDLTIPEAHCAVACTAMEMGCHVIGEKPMASSMAEARKMVRTAEKTKKLFMVSQMRRWDHHHDVVRRTLEAKKIGHLTTVNCDFYSGAHFGGFRDEMPSPLILDMAIHHFDLARFMTGADPVAVYAREFSPRGSWYKGDASAMVTFEMTDGVVFSYRGSWCAEGGNSSWNGDWQFYGSKGMLAYEKDQPPRGTFIRKETAKSRDFADVPVVKTPLKHTLWHGALREMLAYIRTGKKPQCECHDNIKSLAMVFSVIESSKKGKRVPVRVF